MNSFPHHLLIQILKTTSLHTDSGWRARLFTWRGHGFMEAVQDSSTAVLAEKAFHVSPFNGEPGVDPHRLRDRLWELKGGEDG